MTFNDFIYQQQPSPNILVLSRCS